MINVGIVGGTGYTGVELLRLLVMHPNVTITQVTSRSAHGTRVDEFFPNLRQHIDLRFAKPDVGKLGNCDLIFFATPNGTAMKTTRELLDKGCKVIDLSADFRLKDAKVWEHWYGQTHICPELLAEAVYGLPEVNRGAIENARLIANPGCYPTAVQLGWLPLIEQQLINTNHLIADTKSGVSGAGRKASIATLMSETYDSFKAYGVAGHRHLPEIEQGLTAIGQNSVQLTFSPHLTPMIRGIHATLYAQLIQPDGLDLQACYENRFAATPFVDILPPGSHPDTKSVRGSNVCRIAVHQPQNRNMVVVLAVIDNLIKGAAGQAVQNMNIMFGWEETIGLQAIALSP